MVSWRISKRLETELKKVAKQRGWTTTEVVMTALDQFVVWAKKK